MPIMPPMRTLASWFGLAALALAASCPVHADLPEIKQRGVLRVLAPADENPAWFALEAAEQPGFEREVLEGFARLQGLKLEIYAVQHWEEAIPDLLKSRGDLIAGMNATEARRRQVAFAVELVPSQHVVVTLKPRPVVATVEQLRAERVGVTPGTTWAEAVVKAGLPPARVEACADFGDCLEALRAERITATVMDLADLLLEGRHDNRLQGGLRLGPALSSAWGLRKGDTVLLRGAGRLPAAAQSLAEVEPGARQVLRRRRATPARPRQGLIGRAAAPRAARAPGGREPPPPRCARVPRRPAWPPPARPRPGRCRGRWSPGPGPRRGGPPRDSSWSAAIRGCAATGAAARPRACAASAADPAVRVLQGPDQGGHEQLQRPACAGALWPAAARRGQLRATPRAPAGRP